MSAASRAALLHHGDHATAAAACMSDVYAQVQALSVLNPQPNGENMTVQTETWPDMQTRQREFTHAPAPVLLLIIISEDEVTPIKSAPEPLVPLVHCPATPVGMLMRNSMPGR